MLTPRKDLKQQYDKVRIQSGKKGLPVKGISWIVLSFGLSIFVALSGLSMGAELELLFEDDFTSTPVGEPPRLWSVSGNSGHLQVVEDADGVAGRAVQILGDHRRASSMNVRIPTEHSVIIVEHALRWVEGFGLNYWLGYTAEETFGRHNINWFPDLDGNLALRVTNDEGKTEFPVIGKLAEGWNYIRLVVNFEERQTLVELNGQEVVGPFPFWNEVDEWNQVRLTFYDTGRWSTRSSGSSVSETESYYGGVKIWGTTP